MIHTVEGNHWDNDAEMLVPPDGDERLTIEEHARQRQQELENRVADTIKAILATATMLPNELFARVKEEVPACDQHTFTTMLWQINSQIDSQLVISLGN